MIDERDAIKKVDDPSGEETTQSSDSPYKVGPGHPPLESQFKKGAPSPNPKGRPRKNASIAPDLKKALEEALNKKVRAKKGETQVLLSKATLGIEQLVNQFAKGDRYARRDLMDMAKELGVDLLADQKGKIQEAIQPSHQAILDAYLARQPPPVPTFKPRVQAPNELRDGLMDRRVTRPLTPPIIDS